LREAARAGLLPAPGARAASAEREGYDVVLIGRPAAEELPLAVLAEEAARVRARLDRVPPP
jgi:hypothetical protein